MENFEKLFTILDEVFGEDSFFCEEKCLANGKCNGCCCYEQIKEMFEDLK